MNRIHWARLATATALAALALAGCKKEAVTAKNESVESVAKKVQASSIKPQPGRWESTMKFEKMDLPNMPAQAKAMMNKQMAISQTFATCLTPEQADKPDASFFQKNASGCAYDRFAMTDGKIDAVMTCNAAQGHPMKIAMAGDYSPTAYNIHVSSQGEMQPGMPVSMQMSVAAHRTGECTGNEEK
jgi:hypothetical protein